ncbi:MAG: methyltransferase domain-containing protein [Candidatus Pacebacteria bacterium]|nr:methyltransferase domain-containing protein [Candidatus Paceibacterota bacterium]
MATDDHKSQSVEGFIEKFNFDPCVSELLKSIESDNERIKDLIISKYLQMPLSSREEEDVLEYFINNSVFSAATLANPATSVVTEFLYDPKAAYPIDKYFFKSKGGKAIHSRLIRVEENLHLLIEEHLKNGKVLIGNLGGGLGRDVVDVFSKYYRDNNNVAAINVDKDKNATKRGKRIAEAGGVSNKIKFIEDSFTRYKSKEKFDIIILVGVLCSLPVETCALILKGIKPLLAKNGSIMISNATPRMLDDDPFTYFIMNIMGWRLIFKDEELLKDIFDKAGFKWQRVFTDDYGFHNMAIGIKNNSFFNRF